MCLSKFHGVLYVEVLGLCRVCGCGWGKGAVGGGRRSVTGGLSFSCESASSYDVHNVPATPVRTVLPGVITALCTQVQLYKWFYGSAFTKYLLLHGNRMLFVICVFCSLSLNGEFCLEFTNVIKAYT